ncbi:MAG: hypothetical protein HDS65_07405 [Bacteroidales bacterium]|nr:hypothetical protein [Bacteroidales bacterium]
MTTTKIIDHMNIIAKFTLISFAAISPFVVSACGEEYLTYNHTPGEALVPDEPEPEPEMPDVMTVGTYKLLTDKPAQVIEGLGFEIQNEMTAAPDIEKPSKYYGVPLDLVPSERKRLAEEMLKGFRYMRLGMGVWYQGLTPDRKNFVERIPGQNEALVQLMKDAGVEGISLEYWSPAPYWKSNGSINDGTLKSFDDEFINEFTDALMEDIKYLKSNGFNISTWGLQNESQYESVGYAHCHYTPDQLVKVFGVAAPKVRALDPNIEIIYDTNSGNNGEYGEKLWKENPQLLPYVDAWVYHRIGDDADFVMDRCENYKENNQGKPIYQNEYEYFNDQMPTHTYEWFMVNTAQSIMNWMTFVNSPKWYWLHALKAVDDHVDRDGFGLGIWRPSYANDSHDYPTLKHGHFTFNWQNFNGIAGFLKYMPWNSRRYEVQEDNATHNNRIMAWKTPEGKFVIALTNRSDEWYEFNVDLDKNMKLTGHRYNKNGIDQDLGTSDGSATLSAKVRPWSIEFWVED